MNNREFHNTLLLIDFCKFWVYKTKKEENTILNKPYRKFRFILRICIALISRLECFLRKTGTYN